MKNINTFLLSITLVICILILILTYNIFTLLNNNASQSNAIDPKVTVISEYEK